MKFICWKIHASKKWVEMSCCNHSNISKLAYVHVCVESVCNCTLFIEDRVVIEDSMASAEQLSELLVHYCTVGDPHTLRQVKAEYPEVDFNMTTEGGVTLLMHTIIGAGK